MGKMIISGMYQNDINHCQGNKIQYNPVDFIPVVVARHVNSVIKRERRNPSTFLSF